MDPKITRYLTLLSQPSNLEDVIRETLEVLPIAWRDPAAWQAIFARYNQIRTLAEVLQRQLESVAPLAQAYQEQAAKASEARQGVGAITGEIRSQKNGASTVPAAEAPGPLAAEANGKSVSASP